ncbi:hypothetical protein RFI_25021 [Reticulomyxa filosa]|uniref:Uncharacterized protein n=1 Tax=Reticulomyxa filosa TaxID=46433 RepID=X6MEC0_RETFI|nr:hypothetical protein RFI_25021 [Reticulomyxa filosa]|eukprot:ETO12353.1 hypothetical protein RFI_25021 [Reticulomyxa filosa]
MSLYTYVTKVFCNKIRKNKHFFQTLLKTYTIFLFEDNGCFCKQSGKQHVMKKLPFNEFKNMTMLGLLCQNAKTVKVLMSQPYRWQKKFYNKNVTQMMNNNNKCLKHKIVTGRNFSKNGVSKSVPKESQNVKKYFFKL